jgi:hypothetical protein
MGWDFTKATVLLEPHMKNQIGRTLTLTHRPRLQNLKKCMLKYYKAKRKESTKKKHWMARILKSS